MVTPAPITMLSTLSPGAAPMTATLPAVRRSDVAALRLAAASVI